MTGLLGHHVHNCEITHCNIIETTVRYMQLCTWHATEGTGMLMNTITCTTHYSTRCDQSRKQSYSCASTQLGDHGMSVVTVSRLELVSMFEQEAIVRLVGRTDGNVSWWVLCEQPTVKLRASVCVTRLRLQGGVGSIHTAADTEWNDKPTTLHQWITPTDMRVHIIRADAPFSHIPYLLH